METKKKLTAMNVHELTSMKNLTGGAASGGTITGTQSQKYHSTGASGGNCGDYYYDIYDDSGRWISLTTVREIRC